MSLDQHLPETLRRTAEEHSAPFPDLPSIVEGGRRRKRRRDLRRVSVVAACIAVVAAVPFVVRPFVTDSTAPTDQLDLPRRVEDLPAGAVPAIPYCPGDRTIRGAGDPIEAACDILIHRGSTTLFLDRHGVNVLKDGQLTLLDSRDWSSWLPALSHDGRWAAWVTGAGPGKAVLLGFDLKTGEQVAEEPWPTPEGFVQGIDDLGRVYFQDYAREDMLMHDLRTGDTLDVTGMPEHAGRSKYVTNDGFAVYVDGVGVVRGSVTADGQFTQQHVVDYEWGTQFSPDRSLVSYERDGRFVVGAPSGDAPVVPLKLPTEGSPVWFPVWEGPETVLVQFDPFSAPRPLGNGLDVPARRTWLLRCEVTEGSCEVALAPGWGDRAAWIVHR
ncbi:hypothetical protein [Nocardioides sp.]|uniref:hypothetical protein n=1 Tax=Nocardioides sp. TaxID=35761 RepID=UPI002ED25E40